MRWKSLLTLGLVAVAAGRDPASAQANFTAMVIGNTVGSMVAAGRACITGQIKFSEAREQKLRNRAELALQAYLRLAGSAAAVDTRPLFMPAAFYAKKSSAYWTEDSAPVWRRDGQVGDAAAVDDPVARSFATSGAAFDVVVKREAFILSGDRRGMVGVWRVVAADNPSKVMGRYRLRFFQNNAQQPIGWSLLSLELVSGDAQPAKLDNYCSKPGDVEKFLAEEEKAKAERARRKAERARLKAEAG